MINISYPTTSSLPPENIYEAVTYAYDLLRSQDKQAMLMECKRLERKGDRVVVYYYDTRPEPREVAVAVEKVTSKPSVFGEIWREIR